MIYVYGEGAGFSNSCMVTVMHELVCREHHKTWGFSVIVWCQFRKQFREETKDYINFLSHSKKKIENVEAETVKWSSLTVCCFSATDGCGFVI